MNGYLISTEKIVSGKAKKISAAQKDLPNEELRKTVRRAVKTVAVPIDLESKVLNLLRKQS
jgi:hypothetical protein